MSRFDGCRVYNGCPDSTLQKRLDDERKAYEAEREALSAEYPNLSCTYFPDGEFWQAFSDYRPIGSEASTRVEALRSVQQTAGR